jgi:hypothetical protein
MMLTQLATRLTSVSTFQHVSASAVAVRVRLKLVAATVRLALQPGQDFAAE